MAKEIWKTIKGYDNSYEVSTLGRVRSFKKSTSKILKPTVKGKYLFVGLYQDGKLNQKLVHRLVVETFIGPCVQVDHENLDRMDNRLDNLRISSCSMNNVNKGKKPNCSSIYKGVSKRRDKWYASTKFQGKSYNLGVFNDEKDAARVYDIFAIEHFGKFAKTNKDMGLL